MDERAPDIEVKKTTPPIMSAITNIYSGIVFALWSPYPTVVIVVTMKYAVYM